MSMGAYDEDEHERRVRKSGTVDADFEGAREEYRGSVEFEAEESADEMLDRFRELQDE